jgi:hypothetical protein
MFRSLNPQLLAVAAIASAVVSTSTAAYAGTSNPCALVTTAEASTAMRVSSLPGKPHTSRGSSSCRYYSPDHTKNVYIQILQAGDMTGAAQLAGPLGGKSISGIGDKALWVAGSMYVQKGGSYVQVALYLNPASMKKMDPGVIPLAKTVAGRM